MYNKKIQFMTINKFIFLYYKYTFKHRILSVLNASYFLPIRYRSLRFKLTIKVKIMICGEFLKKSSNQFFPVVLFPSLS